MFLAENIDWSHSLQPRQLRPHTGQILTDFSAVGPVQAPVKAAPRGERVNDGKHHLFNKEFQNMVEVWSCSSEGEGLKVSYGPPARITPAVRCYPGSVGGSVGLCLYFILMCQLAWTCRTTRLETVPLIKSLLSIIFWLFSNTLFCNVW